MMNYSTPSGSSGMDEYGAVNILLGDPPPDTYRSPSGQLWDSYLSATTRFPSPSIYNLQ